MDTYRLRGRRRKEGALATLEDGVLKVRQGEVEERMALGAIESVRLTHDMASEYSPDYYTCELRTAQAKIVLSASHDEPEELQAYRAFLKVLHAELSELPRQPAYVTGMRNKTGLYLMLGIFLLLFGLCEVATIWGMVEKGKYVLGTLMAVGIPALAYLVFKIVLYYGKPGTYDPQGIPPKLLPKGQI